VAAGIASGLLMRLLRFVERTTYNANTGSFLNDVLQSSPHRRIFAMALAGLLTSCVIAISPFFTNSALIKIHPPSKTRPLRPIVILQISFTHSYPSSPSAWVRPWVAKQP
jgi:hypothetical protein